MRIGVDLDNTIFCTDEQYKKYQKEYILKNNITEEELWSNKDNRLDFIRNNFGKIFSDVKLKSNCLDVLNELKEKGNEIFIITARSNEYCDYMYKFTKNSLDKNNVPCDKLILTEKHKLSACLENKIDIMIDDSEYIIDELKDQVRYLLFDDKNKYPNYKYKVTNWNEIKKIIGGD